MTACRPPVSSSDSTVLNDRVPQQRYLLRTTPATFFLYFCHTNPTRKHTVPVQNLVSELNNDLIQIRKFNFTHLLVHLASCMQMQSARQGQEMINQLQGSKNYEVMLA